MEDSDATFYEGFSTLAYAAAVTNFVSLGTAAAIPSRSPLQLAQLVATLTELNGRQFLLGLGAGFRDSEFQTTDLRNTTLRERATEVVPEVIQILRAAWAGPFRHVGQRYSIPQVDMRPRPSVRPAIWYGGTSPLSLRLAAEHCDGWMPGRITHRTLSERLRSVQQTLLSGRERPFAIAAIPLICIGESREDALSGVDVASLLKYANEHRWIMPPERGEFIDPEDLAGLLLFGTPENIVRQLVEYPAFGVTDVILDLRLRPDRIMETLDVIGHTIVPAVKAADVG